MVRHRNAISLIEIDDINFQVRPQRTIIIPKRETLNKVVIYRFCVFFAYKTKRTLSIKESWNATVKTLITHESDRPLTKSGLRSPKYQNFDGETFSEQACATCMFG